MKNWHLDNSLTEINLVLLRFSLYLFFVWTKLSHFLSYYTISSGSYTHFTLIMVIRFILKSLSIFRYKVQFDFCSKKHTSLNTHCIKNILKKNNSWWEIRVFIYNVYKAFRFSWSKDLYRKVPRSPTIY